MARLPFLDVCVHVSAMVRLGENTSFKAQKSMLRTARNFIQLHFLLQPHGSVSFLCLWLEI